MTGRAYGIPTVALRFFNVFGTRQALSNPYTGVLAIFASRLLNGNPPLIFEDGLQQRDFVSVYDIAQACRLALEVPDAAGRVFNVGSGTPTRCCRSPSRWARCSARSTSSRRSRASTASATSATASPTSRWPVACSGMSRKVTLEDGLEELAAVAGGAGGEDHVAEGPAGTGRTRVGVMSSSGAKNPQRRGGGEGGRDAASHGRSGRPAAHARPPRGATAGPAHRHAGMVPPRRARSRRPRAGRPARRSACSELRTGISWADAWTPEGEAWYAWLFPQLARRVNVLPCFVDTPPAGASRQDLRPAGQPQELRRLSRRADHAVRQVLRVDRAVERAQRPRATGTPSSTRTGSSSAR